MSRTSTREEAADDLATAESAFYVYGLTTADTDVPAGLEGIGGVRPELVSHQGVAAVVTTVEADRPLARRADVLAHSRVLDEIAATSTVLPMRFGSVMPDAASVAGELLVPHAEHIAELLDQLAGHVQLVLRATYVEEVVLAEVVQGDDEIAELRRRTRDLPEEAAYGDRVRLGELVARSMEMKRADDGDHLMSVVAPEVAAYHVRQGTGVEHLLDVALLVDAAKRGDVEQRLEALAEAVHERIRLSLLGPTAPYDFVGETAWV